MPRRTFLVVLGAAIALPACAFDLPDVRGTSSSTAGTTAGTTASTTTGHGGADAGGACLEQIDVATLVVTARPGSGGPCTPAGFYGDGPALANLGGTWGVAWTHHHHGYDEETGKCHGATETGFASFTATGATSAVAQLGAPQGDAIPAAAAGSAFVVASSVVSTAALLDATGTAVGTATGLAPSAGDRALTAGVGGVLLTSVAPSGGNYFQAQWLADGAAAFTGGQPIPSVTGEPPAGGGRRWTVARTPTGFAVAWPSTNGVSWFRLGPTGAAPPGGATEVPGLTLTAPQRPLLAAHGDGLVVGSCEAFVVVDAGGAAGPKVTLPEDGATSCTLSSSGSALRMARVVAGVIQWHDVDPTKGVGPPLFQIGSGAARAEVLPDETGFGLAWTADAVYFAHLTCVVP